MSKSIRVSRTFEKNILKLIAQALGMVAGVGNPTFAHWFILPIIPSLATISAAIVALQQAQAVADTKAHGAAAIRDAKALILRQLLGSLATYVQGVVDANTADGHAIIAAAGFKEADSGTRTVLPLKVTSSTAGAAKAKAKAGPKGKRLIYEFRYTLDGGHTFTAPVQDSYPTRTFTGLPSLTVVGFQVRISVNGVFGEWSQTVTCLIL